MLRKFCTWEKKKIGNKSRALRVRERAKRRSQKMVQFLTKYPRSWFDFENFARCWLAEVVCSAFSSSSLLRVVHFVVLVALILFFSAMHSGYDDDKIVVANFSLLFYFYFYFKSFTAKNSSLLSFYFSAVFHLLNGSFCIHFISLETLVVWWCWWWLPRRYLSM